MLAFTHNSLVDTGKYEEHLRYRGYIYIDLALMRDMLKGYQEKQDTLRYLALDTMNISSPSSKRYAVLSKDTVLNYLIDDCNIDEGTFRKKGVQGLSLDSKKVLAPLMTRLTGYPKEMLEYYSEHNSLKSKNSRIENVTQDLVEDEELVTRDGRHIAKLAFSVSQQDNLRYNYRNEDIISLAKDYMLCTVVPDGYILAWGDYAQSDWRIAYNLLVRDERNAQIMDACADKYEGIARVLCNFYDEEFDYDSFKANRGLYKVYVLQTIYGQRNGLDEESSTFIRRFTKYLETCPRYMKFYNDLQRRLTKGSSVEIMSYFGYKTTVGNGLRERDALNKALNTPNQTGTSEIVILTVNAIMDKFASLGYTEEDVSVYFVRHDEPIFIMKESVMKDSWVFANCSDIYVDDWTPLKLTFEFGYRYGEADTDLFARYEVSTAVNDSKLDKQIPEAEHFDYAPILKYLNMSMCAMSTYGNKILLTYYAYDDNKASFELLEASRFSNEDEIAEYMKERVRDFTLDARQQGYGSIDCHSLFNTTDYGGVIRVVYRRDQVYNYNKALLLSDAYLLDLAGKRYENMTDQYAPYFRVLDTHSDLLGI